MLVQQLQYSECKRTKEQKWETQHQKNKPYLKKSCSFSLKIRLCSIAGLINNTKKELFSYIHAGFYIKKTIWLKCYFLSFGGEVVSLSCFCHPSQEKMSRKKKETGVEKLNKNYSGKNIESYSFFSETIQIVLGVELSKNWANEEINSQRVPSW